MGRIKVERKDMSEEYFRIFFFCVLAVLLLTCVLFIAQLSRGSSLVAEVSECADLPTYREKTLELGRRFLDEIPTKSVTDWDPVQWAVYSGALVMAQKTERELPGSRAQRSFHVFNNAFSMLIEWPDHQFISWGHQSMDRL